MFKNGGFYLTAKGQLVKLFDSFKFADGYIINAAVFITGGANGGAWSAVRYSPEGRCNNGDATFAILATETFEKYRNYLTFVVHYDKVLNTWLGKANDPRGQIIVDLVDIQNPERALQLIQLGAEQKLLTWMREAGYDEVEKKESV